MQTGLRWSVPLTKAVHQIQGCLGIHAVHKDQQGVKRQNRVWQYWAQPVAASHVLLMDGSALTGKEQFVSFCEGANKKEAS